MSPDLTGAVWSKSSYSGGSEGQCVGVANVISTYRGIAIRDSKDPTGPALLFAPDAFNRFVASSRRGWCNGCDGAARAVSADRHRLADGRRFLGPGEYGQHVL